MICFLCLLLSSIFWTIQPIFNSRVRDHYANQDYSSMAQSLFIGFTMGLAGAAFFILATSYCDSLSKAVAYTYALPIVLSTVASIFLYNEVIGPEKWFGIILILIGLYLI